MNFSTCTVKNHLIDKATSFDFIEYGSKDTYRIAFRIVCFSISDETYEYIVTNLPEDEFSKERIKQLYFSRWGDVAFILLS